MVSLFPLAFQPLRSVLFMAVPFIVGWEVVLCCQAHLPPAEGSRSFGVLKDVLKCSETSATIRLWRDWIARARGNTCKISIALATSRSGGSIAILLSAA